MATVYQDIIPSLIENTTMKQGFVNGIARQYHITPMEGYVLHDKRNDMEAFDEVTGMPLLDENGNPVMVLGYARGTVSCAASYDFETNPWEFYAVPADSVPADQIFGGVDSKPEIM